MSTTDFFYPLVEDPFLQGKIAAANVLSDMYAFGVVRIDSMLMLLSECYCHWQRDDDDHDDDGLGMSFWRCLRLQGRL